jgi:hypothetical protein
LRTLARRDKIEHHGEPGNGPGIARSGDARNAAFGPRPSRAAAVVRAPGPR